MTGRRLAAGTALAFLLSVVIADTSFAVSESSCAALEEFHADRFPSAPVIDNPWLPMSPGMQLILEGRADRGGGLVAHRVIFTVTDLTKTVAGVNTIVVWDQDVNEGELAEAELAFFAEDEAGNVWNLGEYPEEYEGGTFVGAPSTWIAGEAGAEAGVHMPAVPRPGGPYYLQGSAPAIDFLDCAKVFKRGQSVCTPAACSDHVLVTDEESPLDHDGGRQRKYHAPGIGIMQVGAVGDPEGETLVLVEARRLSGAALRAARRAALALDRRAYAVSDVYGATPPAVRMSP